jgi:peptide/nickel transport system substrate-binding protein/oligopeptide transport system substrate-binding protein
VAFYLAAVAGFKEMQSGQASELTGVEAPDAYTLRITLTYPFADFPYGLALPVLAPVPREEVERDPRAYSEMPVGNGPFKMAEPWSHDQYVRVVRFEDYSGVTPLLDGVDFRIFKDQETAYLEFKAGAVDTALIPTGQVQAAVEDYGESANGLEASPGHQVLLGPTRCLLSRHEWPGRVAKDRSAPRLSLAINREAMPRRCSTGRAARPPA